MSECKCETVKRYDDVWECIQGPCRKIFVAKDGEYVKNLLETIVNLELQLATMKRLYVDLDEPETEDMGALYDY